MAALTATLPRPTGASLVGGRDLSRAQSHHTSGRIARVPAAAG